MNPDLIKTYDAGGAIVARRLVKFSADGVVVQAAAKTDLIIGVSGALTVADGDRVDVTRSGLALVEFGGAVTRGQKLTSDADGKAIAVTAASGANAEVIGIAEVNAVDGDIGAFLIAPSIMQGE